MIENLKVPWHSHSCTCCTTYAVGALASENAVPFRDIISALLQFVHVHTLILAAIHAVLVAIFASLLCHTASFACTSDS